MSSGSDALPIGASVVSGSSCRSNEGTKGSGCRVSIGLPTLVWAWGVGGVLAPCSGAVTESVWRGGGRIRRIWFTRFDIFDEILQYGRSGSYGGLLDIFKVPFVPTNGYLPGLFPLV